MPLPLCPQYIQLSDSNNQLFKLQQKFNDIIFEKSGGVAKITINRPEVRNAFRPETIDEMVKAFDERRKVILRELNQIPGFRCAEPGGAFYAFPNIKATGWRSKPLAKALLENAGVALIGGPDFGEYGEGYVRVSCASSDDNIRAAFERIGDFLADNNPE